MNVFDNIAVNNTDEARKFLDWHNYQYDPNDPSQIADGLQTIAQVSEDHAKDVLNMHPDKNIILYLFSTTPGYSNPSGIDNPEKRVQFMKQSLGADGTMSAMSVPATPAPAVAASSTAPADVTTQKQMHGVTPTDLVIVMASLLIAFAIV